NFGHLINIRRFFQVTAIFLLLFMGQIAIYSFLELCEAGVFPNSEVWHDRTEVFSPESLFCRRVLVLSIRSWRGVLGRALGQRQLQKGRRNNKNKGKPSAKACRQPLRRLPRF